MTKPNNTQEALCQWLCLR